MFSRTSIARPAILGLAVAALVPVTLASAAPDDGPASEKGGGVRSSVMFSFKDDRIKESSGIETSVKFRRIVYTHNDSGDDARFFAVGRSGATKAVYTLNGAGSWDWEDMSAGPNDTLWFGDIGANQLGRESIAAFRVREPRALETRRVPWTRFNFVYADGQSHNAEALLVNPISGRLYIVTKAENNAGVYAAPRRLSTAHNNTLRRIADAPTKVTGGAFTPNGKRLVLRNWQTAFFYNKIGGRVTNEIHLPSGGESIAYARYRPGIIIGSEGVHSKVWHVVRTGG